MCKLNINNLKLEDCTIADIQFNDKRGRNYKYCYKNGKRISQKEHRLMNEMADRTDSYLTEKTHKGNYKHSHYVRYEKEWKKTASRKTLSLMLS